MVFFYKFYNTIFLLKLNKKLAMIKNSFNEVVSILCSKVDYGF